jgi:hypothetical protein
MSTLRFSLAIAAVLALGAPLRVAHGQITSQLDNGKHPFLFIEPDTFRPDFQFFAPADATNYEFGADRDPRRGFFFTFDRAWIAVSRPETDRPLFPPTTAPPVPPTAPVGGGDPQGRARFSFVAEDSSPYSSDFTWGNRIELGFIDNCDKGWTIVGWHVDGPNKENSITNGDRLAGPYTDQGVLPDDQIDPVTDDTTFIQQNIGGPYYPPDPTPTAFTDLPIQTTVNTMKMSSIELMRIMDRWTFHNGAICEPMVGVRYIKLQDRFHYSFYERLESDGPPFVIDDVELYRDQLSYFQNDMVGGQLGFRLFKETGHWTLSSEFRMFAMQNFQNFASTIDNYIWSTGDPAAESPLRTPGYARQERFVSYQHGSEFSWGGELKMEAAYMLTRDISFRTGFVFLDIGEGVGRGLTYRHNNQDVQMYGYTFGLTINR